MFGMGTFEFELLIPVVGLIVWFRVFRQGKRFSLLSLFILLTGVAIWLAVFKPWGARVMF